MLKSKLFPLIWIILGIYFLVIGSEPFLNQQAHLSDVDALSSSISNLFLGIIYLLLGIQSYCESNGKKVLGQVILMGSGGTMLIAWTIITRIFSDYVSSFNINFIYLTSGVLFIVPLLKLSGFGKNWTYFINKRTQITIILLAVLGMLFLHQFILMRPHLNYN